MKKFTVICVLMIIVILAVVPSVAMADIVNATGGNVCLINPIAITSIGDYIFVADDVDVNHSVILCFNIARGTPSYKFTYSSERRIKNLSEADGKLCVIYQDGISVFEVSDTVFKTPYTTYAVENVVDMTFGKYQSETMHYATYVLNNEDLFYTYQDDTTQSFKPTDYSLEFEEITSCLYVDNNSDDSLNGYVYCIWDYDIKRFNTATGQWGLRQDDFNKLGVYATELMVKGIFNYQINGVWQIGLYSDTAINKLEKRHYGLAGDREWEYGAMEAVPLDRSDTDVTILDVCYSANKLFVLNANKQVEIYAFDAEKSAFVRQEVSIGTDMIAIGDALPTNFTGFFLAQSLGYPTNIVYKTTDPATSVTSIIPDYKDEFIILDFEGSEFLPFYYVLIGDKYGWVKKSDGAVTPGSDPKIQPINTNINPAVPDVTYKAKFISANTVFVYELPISGSSRTEFHQTVTTPKDVTILQVFTEKAANETVEWYYISYEDAEGNEQKGFIQSGLVGQFYTTSNGSGNIYGEDKKINASLFEAVNIFATSDMSEQATIHDKDGNVIKLYSGTFVKVISEEGDASYIEVKINGTATYGWIQSDKLINRISMTTNAIVGLSILGAAIVIGVTFAIVFTKRKKHKTNSPTEQQPLLIEDSNEEE